MVIIAAGVKGLWCTEGVQNVSTQTPKLCFLVQMKQFSGVHTFICTHTSGSIFPGNCMYCYTGIITVQR